MRTSRTRVAIILLTSVASLLPFVGRPDFANADGTGSGASAPAGQQSQDQPHEDAFAFAFVVPQAVAEYDPLTASCTRDASGIYVANAGLTFQALRVHREAAETATAGTTTGSAAGGAGSGSSTANLPLPKSVADENSTYELIRFDRINPNTLDREYQALHDSWGNLSAAGKRDMLESRFPLELLGSGSGLATTTTTKGPLPWLTSKQNGKVFCLAKTTFDELSSNKGIQKVYYTGPTSPTYGLNVSVPFKLRRAISGRNTQLDTGISLGASFGERWRISSTKNYHLVAPVITAGTSTVTIRQGTAPSAADGEKQALAVSASVGAVIELGDSFQLGFMIGFDRVPGSEGEDWVYNGKLWYSFAIGVSLLSNSKQ